jgi:hypothetical protein
MLGFQNNKTRLLESALENQIKSATDFADVYHFLEPEQTTFRLRHALNQIDSVDDLKTGLGYSELLLRGAMLSSDLRKKTLTPNEYGRWLAIKQQSIADAKQVIKASLRNPWKNHYDWLGQSLAHSNVMQNPIARRAYEQLAVTYRIQEHLLNHPITSSMDNNYAPATNKNGYQIESMLPTAPQIISKANRLIDYYYSPQIEA